MKLLSTLRRKRAKLLHFPFHGNQLASQALDSSSLTRAPAFTWWGVTESKLWSLQWEDQGKQETVLPETRLCFSSAYGNSLLWVEVSSSDVQLSNLVSISCPLWYFILAQTISGTQGDDSNFHPCLFLRAAVAFWKSLRFFVVASMGPLLPWLTL